MKFNTIIFLSTLVGHPRYTIYNYKDLIMEIGHKDDDDFCHDDDDNDSFISQNHCAILYSVVKLNA